MTLFVLAAGMGSRFGSKTAASAYQIQETKCQV